MKGIRRQLAQPVELTCRQISAALLEDASKACDRLGGPDDPEALHDYRVAVRRLRSFIGAYRNHFPKAIGKKARGRLGKLIKRTNEGRDREVHTTWLETQLQKSTVPKLCRSGFEIALARLTSEGEESDAEMVMAARSSFAAVKAKLEDRLNDPQQSVRVDADGQMLTFADATAGILAHHAGDLRSELAAIQSVDDREQCHRARLASKRLRYVLEPIRSLVTGGRVVVVKLKELQDGLGDLRDVQNLGQELVAMLQDAAMESAQAMAATARREGGGNSSRGGNREFDDCRALAAAIARVRREEVRLFRALERRWLGARSSRFFDKLDVLMGGLSPRGRVARGS